MATSTASVHETRLNSYDELEDTYDDLELETALCCKLVIEDTPSPTNVETHIPEIDHDSWENVAAHTTISEGWDNSTFGMVSKDHRQLYNEQQTKYADLLRDQWHGIHAEMFSRTKECENKMADKLRDQCTFLPIYDVCGIEVTTAERST